MRCIWAKDTHGFYITPLVGVSNVRGVWAFWIGWLYWLWTWQITSESSGPAISRSAENQSAKPKSVGTLAGR